ncbi:MAG: pyrroline-5-carboxylate reductase [Betaproteobacteria bacterium]
MNVTFVGGGNMATAMIGGLLKDGWPPVSIRVVEVEGAARERLAREFGVKAAPELDALSAVAECIVFAVKPQQMRGAAGMLRPFLGSQLVLSIAAGIRLDDLSRWLGGYRKIVRVMPNTPALERSGLSALCASPAMSADDRARAEQIMKAVGTTLWVDDEIRMDAATAVSGSGPAYVFYFIEALQQAGVELGLPPADAQRMAMETFAGAVKLARSSAEDVGTLRRRVTSAGGTTERAVSIMEKEGVRTAIVQAVRAAADRSRELGDELGRDPC